MPPIDPERWTGQRYGRPPGAGPRLAWDVIDMFAILGVGAVGFATIWVVERLGVDLTRAGRWAWILGVVLAAIAAGFLTRITRHAARRGR